MCLITKQSEPIILREDLKVYKILLFRHGKNALSSFQRFEYELGKLYNTKIERSEDIFAYDDIANKKYYNGTRSLDTRNIFYRDSLNSYGAGFHFIKTLKRCNRKELYEDECIYKCIIPKGSEVYFDETDLGVADQIIILKRL